MSTFVPTHRVPLGGLDTRANPDPTAAPNSRLDADLDVAVTQWYGVWAEILCSNGWTAWVDGQLLVAASAAPAPGFRAPAPGSPDYYVRLHEQAFAAQHAAPAAPAAWPAPVATPAQLALSAAAGPGPSALKLTPVLIGAIVAAGSGFLPWFSAETGSSTGFQIPLRFLVQNKLDSLDGPSVGLAIIGLAIAAVACSLKPQLEAFRRGAGLLIAALPTIVVAQVQRSLSEATAGGAAGQQPSLFSILAIGLPVAAAAGLAVALPPRRDPAP